MRGSKPKTYSQRLNLGSTDHKPVISIAFVDENADSKEWLFKHVNTAIEKLWCDTKNKGFKENKAPYNNENIHR